MWNVSFIKVFLFLDKKYTDETSSKRIILKKYMYNIIIFA